MTPEDIAARVQAEVDDKMAGWAAEREATRQREQEQKAAEAAAWRAALGPVAVACGVRPFLIDGTVERARSVFELRDGAVRPKPGVYHPRDPIAELDPVTWLADLRTEADGELIFGK
jgi:hypothetical protein